MQQRLPSLLDPPILFAHRGARAHAPENTIEAFELALRLGATGLETDVWLTADGVPVLDHDGVVRRGLRKRPIVEIPRVELPAHIPSLEEVLAAVGTDFHLSIDAKDPAAARPVADLVRARGGGLPQRTWICHPDLEVLAAWRDELADLRLIQTTALARLPGGPERHAATMAGRGIDGINLRRADWNGGLVVLFHRFDLNAFGWDVQHEHHMTPALRMGLDAVYSDDVAMMHSAFSTEFGG